MLQISPAMLRIISDLQHFIREVLQVRVNLQQDS